MKKFKKIITFGIVTALSIGMLTGCGLLDSEVNELNGTIKGNTYNVGFYSNDGENFMNMSGQKIDMASNTVEEPVYTDGGWGYSETMSSVVTITIDGKEVESFLQRMDLIRKWILRVLNLLKASQAVQ